MVEPTPTQNIKADIHALADHHRVSYRETKTDVLAHHITRLAGDEVQFDATERLVIALHRAGYLSRQAAVLLQAEYLRQARP